jgi:hypothetical protein
LSYSNDTLLWFSYRDGNHLDAKVSPLFSFSKYYYDDDDSPSVCYALVSTAGHNPSYVVNVRAHVLHRRDND